MIENSIHPTAIVESGAELEGVIVGPYCIVRAGARIGKGSELIAHIYIDGHTVMGENNVIYPFASIGMQPQDLKYRGEPSRVVIGDRNQIRESITIHRGTASGQMETRIGSDCLLMAYSHVAHDCTVGDHVVMANAAALAGHVEVHDYAILGGLSAVRQFCRVGTRAFLTAGSMIGLDAPPYCVAEGRRAGLAGINIEGLKRAGHDTEEIAGIKRAYKELFAHGRTLNEGLAVIAQDEQPLVKRFSDFVRASSRGVLHPLRTHAAHEIG